MENLKMKSYDVIGSNTQKIAQLFPHCVTERLGKDGKPELAIDFEKLQAELSNEIIGEGEERYQFTWPDKRAAVRLANTPTTMTLRPCREESMEFDNTQNLYIEGDNLDVLKVLRETYLGKVKIIYIDPPYNTGNDFVYNDDFAQGKGDFEQASGLFDEEGNQTIDPMQRNTESNGRFHTDWLNMIYPRLKVARDLLTEDGVMFVSIDENEIENLRKICDEIFGELNFLNQFVWLNKIEGRQIDGPGAAGTHEYILLYSKNYKSLHEFLLSAEWLKKIMPSVYKGYNFNVKYDEHGAYITTHELHNGNSKFNEETRPTLVFDIYYRYSDGDIIIENVSNNHIHNGYTKIPPHVNSDGVHKYHAYRWSKEKILKEKYNLEFVKYGNSFKVYSKRRDFDLTTVRDIVTDITTNNGNSELGMLDIIGFSYPKPTILLSLLIKMTTLKIEENEEEYSPIILDFFSGSATTAHAVMKLNAEDGGNRKFIMVQLPEKTDEKSEAYKAGYKNICEIGKERIRRAGKKVKEEAGLQGQNLDTGFRVLKLDSSNMEDVYYNPQEFSMGSLFDENVKSDRSNEDLLFQVMLDLGIELSAKIETKQIAGKQVHIVDEGYLVACFDRDVNESTIIEIAKQQPVYFVMRDASAANDNVIDNFEQIFRHYSLDTSCRII